MLAFALEICYDADDAAAGAIGAKNMPDGLLRIRYIQRLDEGLCDHYPLDAVLSHYPRDGIARQRPELEHPDIVFVDKLVLGDILAFDAPRHVVKICRHAHIGRSSR